MSKNIELVRNYLLKVVYLRWFWEIVGGFYLLAYLFWYILPMNRVVPHWPLDFAVTAIAGVLLLCHGFLEILRKYVP